MDREEAQNHMAPLVSVVVPVYNAAPFLRRTVQSIAEQTLQNLEILLIDDGSRDDSYAICRELAAGDARIHAWTQANGGAAKARNTGISKAKGQFIGFVDSDDLILPDMFLTLYRQAARLREEGRHNFIVQIGREERDDKGSRLPPAVVPPAAPEWVPAEQFAESLLLYTGDASFCTTLVPAAYMREHLFPEGWMGEDFRLWMEMANDSLEGVLRLPEIGYCVMHRPGSATRRAAATQFSRAYVDIVRHADYVETSLVPHYPALAPAALRFGLYERLDYLLHVPIPDMNAANTFYCNVVSCLRRNFLRMWRVPHLTAKNRLYLTILSIAPRKARQLHWKLRGKAIRDSYKS